MVWYWVKKLEGMLFLPAFLVYAALFHVPHSLRCRRCRRLLFNYSASRLRICVECARELLLNPVKAYGERGEDIVVTGVSSSGNHIYTPVAKRVGYGKILDVGCGQGHIMSKMRGVGQELYCFDISSGLVKIARRQVKRGAFLVADAQYIPFKSEFFDFVVCSEVLEHIAGDKAVRECHRVLKPGGTALFTVPNRKGAGGGYQPDHKQCFDSKSFASFVEAAGFKVVSGHKVGLYVPIISHLLDVTALALRRNLPLSGPLPMEVPAFLAANLLLECRKPPALGTLAKTELQPIDEARPEWRPWYLAKREFKRFRRVGPGRFLAWEIWLLLTTYPRYRRDLAAFFRLLGKDKVVVKNIVGDPMYLDIRDKGSTRELAFEGIREPLTTKAILNEIKPGAVVVDIGANIGYYAIKEARLVGPEGWVYAIEPVPWTMEVLKRNIALNECSNIQTFHLAAGDRTGKSFMYVPSKWNHAAIVTAGPSALRTSFLDIDTITLDDFIKGKRWPDLVRMDVEGYEYNILQGMSGMLESGRPLSLLIELHEPVRTRALLIMLKQYGFRTRMVIHEEPSQFLMPNRLMRKVTEYVNMKRSGHDMKYGYLDMTLNDLLANKYLTEGECEGFHIWVDRL